MKYHFVSGLPRSGSTLLAALLRQNPRFHADMTSPVGGLFSVMLNQFSAGSEHSVRMDQASRARLLKGVFDNYYAPQSDRQVVFDTNRQWCARLPDLLRLFPQARLIACVRNVAWVLDSLERKYRETAFENTRLFSDDGERNTVYSRVETLAQRNRMVGYAWAAAKEAYYGEHAASMLVVDYELLARTPAKVMQLIYQFIDEPMYEHDFENVEFEADEFDRSLGVEGLHRVRARVEWQERATVLPPDLFEQYSALSFWNEPTSSTANVIRIKK